LLYTGGAIDGAEALRIGLAHAGLAALDETIAAIRASDSASLETLKRGIALARRGVVNDEAQDRTFDALLRADELVCRLAKRRKA
jgi:enoyl-CoA hydratase/carnithine racemase